jgi:hypothetical protein
MAKKRQTGQDLLDQYLQDSGYAAMKNNADIERPQEHTQSVGRNTSKNGQALLDEYLQNGGGRNVKNREFNPNYRTMTRAMEQDAYEAAYERYKRAAESQERYSRAAEAVGNSPVGGYLWAMQQRQPQGRAAKTVAHDQQSGYRRTREVKSAQVQPTIEHDQQSGYLRTLRMKGSAEYLTQSQEDPAWETVRQDQARGGKRTQYELRRQIEQLEKARDYALSMQGDDPEGLPELRGAYDAVNAGRTKPMTLTEMDEALREMKVRKQNAATLANEAMTAQELERKKDAIYALAFYPEEWTPEQKQAARGILESQRGGSGIFGGMDRAPYAFAPYIEAVRSGDMDRADEWEQIYNMLYSRLFEKTTAVTEGFAEGLGLRSVEKVVGAATGAENPAWEAYMRSVQVAKAQNPALSAGGQIAGSLALMGGISKGIGAASGALLGTKAAQLGTLGRTALSMGQSALTFAARDAIQSAGAAVTGEKTGGAYARDILASGAGGAAGSLVSGLIATNMAQWLMKTGNSTPFWEFVRQSASAFGFSGTSVATSAVLGSEKKSSQEIATELGTAFLFSLVSGYMGTMRETKMASAAVERKYEELEQQISALGKHFSGGAKYKTEAEFTQAVEDLRRTVQGLKADVQGTYYAGQQDFVNQMVAALDRIDYNLLSMMPGAGSGAAAASAYAGGVTPGQAQRMIQDASAAIAGGAQGEGPAPVQPMPGGVGKAAAAQELAGGMPPDQTQRMIQNAFGATAAEQAVQVPPAQPGMPVPPDVAAQAEAAQREANFQAYSRYAEERDRLEQTRRGLEAERSTVQYGQQETGSRNGEGRTESVYPGGQSRGMGEGSEIERTLERQGEAVRLRNRAKDLGAENISPAEAGLKGGDTTKSLLKVPEAAYGAHEKALQKAVEARGASLNIVMGRIRLANGTAVDEFIDTETRQVTVRADCTKWAMDNLIDHALFHGLSTEQRNATAQAVADRFSESELMAIAGQYVKRMRGVYEGMSEDELLNTAMEEVLADAAGRMLRYTDADATKFTETVRGIIGDGVTITEAKTEPTNQRYSISDTLAEDLQQVIDGTYEADKGEVYIGETSNFLTDVIGADALHVTMPANKAYSAMATEEQARKDGRYKQNVNYHGLGADGLRRVLNASENPVAAFADTSGESGKRASNIVLVTGEAGKGGPIVVIETLNTKGTLNGKRIDANKVITSYDRAALISDLEAAASDGRLLYLDKKRSQAALAGVPAANSLAAIQGGDFTTNIRNFIAGVKWEKSGAASYTSAKPDGETSFSRAYKAAQQKQRYSPADTETETSAEDAKKTAAEGTPIFNFDTKYDFAYGADPNPFYRMIGITPPGLRIGIEAQATRAADKIENGQAYAKALLDFATKPDRSTKTLTLNFPNADGTYRSENVQNTKIMQDIYKYYAEAVPEENRHSEADFWMWRRRIAEGSVSSRIETMSAEAKAQAWQESARADFKSTGALEKMGVKVERSIGRYGRTQSLIETEKAYKQAKREVNRAIDRLAATPKEIAFARQIADGVFDMRDIPRGYDRRVVLSLVDYMNAEAALGNDRILAQRKAIRQETADTVEALFSDSADNKVSGMFTLNHRTAQRNMLHIFGDETGRKLNRAIFDPIQRNEAERIRFINKQFDDVRTFEDSTGKKSELTHVESILVQLVMEGKATVALLGDMPGSPAISKAGMKIADGMKPNAAAKSEHLNKNEKQLAKMYASWVSALRMMADGKIDTVKIDNAAKAYTQKYNEFYAAINDFLVAHGYEPIGFIQNYAPHMQAEETRTALDSALKMLGINEDVVTLPTSIAGLTADFKPNKRWNPYFLHRTGETYNFDVAKGFESYVAYMSELFYHTDDIMTVRALSDYLRRRYSPDDISFDIDKYTWLRERMPDEQLLYLQQRGKLEHGAIVDSEQLDSMIDDELTALYENAKNKSKYSNLVVWLDNYANVLAGKQTKGDRSTEEDFGRKTLTIGNKLTRGFGAAKVAGNIATIFNQTAQIPTILAEKGLRNTAAAIKDMATGQLRKTDFALESDYLTSKKGVHFLVTDEKNMYEWALDKVGQAQEFADATVATIAVRAAYLEGIRNGMTHKQAMSYADRYGAQVMGDRSKGAKPVAFNSKNPVMQLINTFQLEVANSWEHVTQDTAGFDFREMARKFGKDKAVKALAGIIVKFLLATYIWNRISDETYGGTPAPYDVLGITSNFIAGGYGLSINDAMKTVMDNGWEKVTGERLFGTEDKARSFNVWKAIEAAGGDIANDIPYLQNASALVGWGDNTLPAAIPTKALDNMINAVKGGKGVKDITKAAFDVGTEIAPGGSQIKKTARGIDAMVRGGVYQGYGDQTKLRYPVDNKNIGKWIQAVVFGPNGLSETGRYYAGEERAIGEKQTTAYQAMIAAGADKEESYRLIRRITKLGDDEDSKLDKLNMLLSSKVSTAGQGAYYYIMMAGDKERERIDALTGEDGVIGMDDYLRAAQKKLQIDADEEMRPTEKADAFRQWVNQQGYSADQKRGVLDAFKFSQIIMVGGGHSELYQAALEGVSEYDTLRADAIAAEKAGGKSQSQAESSVNSSLRSQMKQDYLDGLVDDETASQFLKEYTGSDDDDVFWTMESWKGGDDWKKYGKFFDAVEKGVTADTRKVAKYYMEHGVDKGTLSSQLTTYFKERWLAASGDEAARLKRAYISAYKAIGGDGDDARDNMIKWRQEANKKRRENK